MSLLLLEAVSLSVVTPSTFCVRVLSLDSHSNHSLYIAQATYNHQQLQEDKYHYLADHKYRVTTLVNQQHRSTQNAPPYPSTSLYTFQPLPNETPTHVPRICNSRSTHFPSSRSICLSTYTRRCRSRLFHPNVVFRKLSDETSTLGLYAITFVVGGTENQSLQLECHTSPRSGFERSS